MLGLSHSHSVIRRSVPSMSTVWVTAKGCFLLSETVEDATSGPESLDCLPGGHSQEKGPLQRLGLTKEVLASHTQKEEQSFLQKFREVRRLGILQAHCQHYLQERTRGQSSERGKWPQQAEQGTQKRFSQQHQVQLFSGPNVSPGWTSPCVT